MRWLKVALLLSSILFYASCSRNTLSLFFDIPPKPKEAKVVQKEGKRPPSAQKEARPEVAAPAPASEKEEERPPIEKLLAWEEAKKLLPTDQMGEVDWTEALKKGIIKPRGTIEGREGTQAVFKFDFFLPGPAPAFDAYFPHSSHTEWLTCESCHPKIFPTRGMEMTMEKINEGKLCGKCHGKVAFGTEGCKRCHVKME